MEMGIMDDDSAAYRQFFAKGGHVEISADRGGSLSAIYDT